MRFARAEKSQHPEGIVYEEIATSGRARANLFGFPLVVPLALMRDMVRLDEADLTPLIEALEHGRDGFPRWIVAAVPRDEIIDAAASRGFVPLTIDAYARGRVLGDRALDERTLLLIDSSGDPSRAHMALLQAAAHSPRPHVLLTLRLPLVPSERRESSGPRKPALVREARQAYAAEPADREPAHVTELVARARRAPEFVAAGRHAAAERLLRDVEAALARRGAGRQASRVAITLARMLLQRGHTDAAFESLDRAIRLAQSARCDDLAIEARLWQASARIADAAFVDAESICRAVLEAPRLEPGVAVWAYAILAEALLWQGRADDVAGFDVEQAAILESAVFAAICETRVRCMLARGQSFDAGQCVARLHALTGDSRDSAWLAIVHCADLALLAACGDLARAKQAFEAALAAARTAKLPLRAAWARLTWVDLLRRSRQSDAASPHLECLKRLSRVAPPLLRREIDRRLAADAPAPSIRSAQPMRHASLAIGLLRLMHEDEDDLSAMRLIVHRVSQELQASRLDVLSNAAGPVTAICGVGEGMSTRLGTRVLEAAFAIGPERQGGGWEMGVPVRCGSRMLAAVVCRWPVDRVVPADAAELLELAAVIAAPRLEALVAARRDEAKAATAVPELLGASEAMANVRKAIVRAAAAPFAVLIEGESGVGKELAARAVHHLSARRERKFCDLNCAALPEELLESELFGHARGAFSGAVVDRAGLFEEADGGTLLLDEVADLSARAQAKLLRAIQQQEVRRVGESFSRKIDVRIIAAANRDMRAEAAAGRFRQDLLYRLDVVRIQVPPLRERPADIPLLAEHCLNVAAARTGSKARLSPATLTELSRYHWPGNVRELQNVIASLAVAAPPRGWIRPAVLPSVVAAATPVSSARLADAREQFERRFVEVALARAGGNCAQAARALGLSRQGLVKILARLGLERPASGEESC